MVKNPYVWVCKYDSIQRRFVPTGPRSYWYWVDMGVYELEYRPHGVEHLLSAAVLSPVCKDGKHAKHDGRSD